MDTAQPLPGSTRHDTPREFQTTGIRAGRLLTHALLWGAVLAGLAACGADVDDSPGSVVRDSAGVTIVESTRPAWEEGDAWRVSDSPLVDIGVLDGAPEYQLFRVAGVVRLADGRMVVANSGTGELRYYSAEGEHLRTAGRAGSGPGEFQSISWIALGGADSVLVYDQGLGRISLFSPDGAFVESNTVQAIAGDGTLRPIGRFADGSYLLQRALPGNPASLESGLHRFPSTLFRTTHNSAPDSLGTYPGHEGMVLIGTNTVSVFRGAIMRRLETVVHGETYAVGAQDAYEVELRHMSGEPATRIRWTGPDLAMTPDMIEYHEQQQLRNAPTDEVRRGLEQRLGDMKYPDMVPAYGAVVLDAPGNLWVQEFRRDAEALNSWLVFNPEGSLLGRVQLPEGLIVEEIGADYVLGRWTDELDVEHVRMFGLERG